jgi:polyhydroxyalkanoate synthesis repressor PhaR
METTKASPAQSTSGGHAPKRIIKRYSNRKLYDTRDSRYVTLQQIGEMVRAGEEVQIIDNKTKEDKTEVTLALILSEDLKAQPRSVPLTALRDLIQERGGKLLSQLREGTLGRFIAPGAPGDAPAEAKEAEPVPEPVAASSLRADKKEDEKKPDEKKGRLSELMESSLSSVVPSARAFSELKEEVTALSARVTELEKLLADQKASRRS